MLRASARFVAVLAVLCAAVALPAWAAEEKAPERPLPFLAVGQPECAAGLETPVTPPLPEFLSTGTGTSNICTGCSSHNCFYQTEGTRCTVEGQPGRCVANNYCPELRELSCSCVAP